MRLAEFFPYFLATLTSVVLVNAFASKRWSRAKRFAFQVLMVTTATAGVGIFWLWSGQKPDEAIYINLLCPLFPMSEHCSTAKSPTKSDKRPDLLVSKNPHPKYATCKGANREACESAANCLWVWASDRGDGKSWSAYCRDRSMNRLTIEEKMGFTLDICLGQEFDDCNAAPECNWHNPGNEPPYCRMCLGKSIESCSRSSHCTWDEAIKGWSKCRSADRYSHALR